jgi:hypothetical protein
MTASSYIPFSCKTFIMEPEGKEVPIGIYPEIV